MALTCTYVVSDRVRFAIFGVSHPTGVRLPRGDVHRLRVYSTVSLTGAGSVPERARCDVSNMFTSRSKALSSLTSYRP